MAYVAKKQHKRTVEKQKRADALRTWNDRSILYKIEKYEKAIIDYHEDCPDLPKMKAIIKEYKAMLPKPKKKVTQKKKSTSEDEKIQDRINKKMIKRHLGD